MSDDRRVASTADALQQLSGSPKFVATIAATTTAGGIAIPVRGGVYLLQPDAVVSVAVKDATSATTTIANSLALAIAEKFIVWTAATDLTFDAITPSGTANVKIFQLK